MSVAPNQQIKNGNALKFFKDFWFIVVIIFALAGTWANFTGKITINTKTNVTQQTAIDSNTAAAINYNLKYAEDITFIKTTLDSLIIEKQNGKR